MKDDFENIDDLFEDGLNDLEFTPNSEVWDKIAGGLDQLGATAAGSTSSVASSAVVKSTLLSVKNVVIALLCTTAVATTVIVLNTEDSTENSEARANRQNDSLFPSENDKGAANDSQEWNNTDHSSKIEKEQGSPDILIFDGDTTSDFEIINKSSEKKNNSDVKKEGNNDKKATTFNPLKSIDESNFVESDNYKSKIDSGNSTNNSSKKPVINEELSEGKEVKSNDGESKEFLKENNVNFNKDSSVKPKTNDSKKYNNESSKSDYNNSKKLNDIESPIALNEILDFEPIKEELRINYNNIVHSDSSLNTGKLEVKKPLFPNGWNLSGLYLEVNYFVGQSFIGHTKDSYDEGNPDFRESARNASSFQFDVGYEFRNGFYIGSGIGYKEYGINAFQTIDVFEEMDSISSIQGGYETLDFESEILYGLIGEEDEDGWDFEEDYETYINVSSQDIISSVYIPISLGYNHQRGRWNYFGQISSEFSILQSYDKYIQINDEHSYYPVNFHLVDESFHIGLSTSIKAGMGYQFNKGLGIRGSILYSRGSKFEHSVNPDLLVTPYRIGLNLGLRYTF